MSRPRITTLPDILKDLRRRLRLVERRLNKIRKPSTVSASGRVLFSGVASGATASMAVTFPSGRFSDTPHPVATPQSVSPSVRHVSVNNVTPSGFTIYFTNTAGSSVNIYIHWVAVMEVT